jgi:NAD(P)-dependent dehydrogenase (short-subunit alcohol dehydrogenase family)
MTDNATQEQKIALVTGANKGIGREIAAQLAELGMTVLLAARDPHRREEAAAALRSVGGDVHPVGLDVTDPTTIRAAAKYVDERFGRLDVLVNNAGITGNGGQAPSTADLDTVRQVFETNVFGVIAVTNAMLPLLLRSPAPRIVNVSSGVGSLAAMKDPDSPLTGLPASAAYVPLQDRAELGDRPVRQGTTQGRRSGQRRGSGLLRDRPQQPHRLPHRGAGRGHRGAVGHPRPRRPDRRLLQRRRPGAVVIIDQVGYDGGRRAKAGACSGSSPMATAYAGIT